LVLRSDSHSARESKAVRGIHVLDFRPHNTHAHSADAAPTDVRSNTTTSDALLAERLIPGLLSDHGRG
jgi:hypothetical protein